MNSNLKKIITATAVLSTSVCLFVTGCKGNGGTTSTNPESKESITQSVESNSEIESIVESTPLKEYELYMIETLEVKKFNTAEIEYVLVDGNESDIVWSSADENIATVENGIVIGISEGVVSITATIGATAKTCMVTVTENEAFPAINVSQKDAMPRVGGSVKVNANIRFNGEIVDFDDYIWTSSNEDVATVENGEIKGVSKGEATITVTATFNGVLLSETIIVTVVEVA